VIIDPTRDLLTTILIARLFRFLLVELGELRLVLDMIPLVKVSFVVVA
jgi:hypothetical protein